MSSYKENKQLRHLKSLCSLTGYSRGGTERSGLSTKVSYILETKKHVPVIHSPNSVELAPPNKINRLLILAELQ